MILTGTFDLATLMNRRRPTNNIRTDAKGICVDCVVTVAVPVLLTGLSENALGLACQMNSGSAFDMYRG